MFVVGDRVELALDIVEGILTRDYIYRGYRTLSLLVARLTSCQLVQQPTTTTHVQRRANSKPLEVIVEVRDLVTCEGKDAQVAGGELRGREHAVRPARSSSSVLPAAAFAWHAVSSAVTVAAGGGSVIRVRKNQVYPCDTLSSTTCSPRL